MSLDNLVKRHQKRHKGYSLEVKDCYQAAFPVCVLKLDVFVKEKQKQPLTRLNQFVLRLLGEGTTKSERIAKVLGLEVLLVYSALEELCREQYISISPSKNQDEQEPTITLTNKGQKQLEFLKREPYLKYFNICLDALTGEYDSYIPDSFSPKTELENVRRELPRISKPKGIEELDFGEIHYRWNKWEKKKQKDKPSRSQKELIDVKKIESIWFEYQQRSVLKYVRRDGNILIDVYTMHEFSRSHSEALRKCEQDEKLVEDIREKKKQGTMSFREFLKIKFEDEPPQKILTMIEHRPRLFKALEEATTSVTIVSPWLNIDGMDEEFREYIIQALKRNVHVWICYGYPAYEEKKKEEEELKENIAINLLAREIRDSEASHEYIHLYKYRDKTHAKVVICDDRYMIVTSFNWLSFGGRGERVELGILTDDPRAVKEMYEQLEYLFENTYMKL